jgi:hypothetical protein
MQPKTKYSTSCAIQHIWDQQVAGYHFADTRMLHLVCVCVCVYISVLSNCNRPNHLICDLIFCVVFLVALSVLFS